MGETKEYWDDNKGGGGKRKQKGNSIGPYIVPAGQIVNTLPIGTLIPLDTDPTPLPTTPLNGRKWIKFKNEDLVDIQLCSQNGTVFETVSPGEWANNGEPFIANESVLFYGKVSNGTADTGVRAIEGK